MEINTQLSNAIMSAFFANEFLISIADPILKKYRENIDNYCGSTTGFINQRNPAYEILIDKLTQYFNKYIRTSRAELIKFTCSELCSKFYLNKMNDRDKTALFRKFITACIKSFAARALIISDEYIKLLTDKKKANNLTLFRKNIVQNFEIIISENKNQLFAEFSCLEKGKDPSSVSVINSENRLLEELRKQNEELRFDNMRLQEKLSKTSTSPSPSPLPPPTPTEVPLDDDEENYDEDF